MTNFQQTGYINSIAGESWYGVVGDLTSGQIPLVLLHGGPGFTSYSQEPLSALLDTVPVVFIDQAGCGRAKRGGGRKDFTVDGFVEELESIRMALSLEKMNLLGHSFGALIIGEYYLKYKERVKSLIMQSASIDIPRWVSDSKRLRAQLPMMTKMLLTEGDKSGNYTSPEYLKALTEYYDRHVYRFKEKPLSIIKSEQECDAESYLKIWGPNELVLNGTIAEYSITPKLSAIRVPSLFVCGRYDEATPETHQFFAECVEGAKCIVFEESAHNPQITEEELFLESVREFLLGIKSQ